MNNFLIVNDEDVNFVWDTIQEQQVILHPTIAPDGRFDFKKFFEVKRDKSLVLILDRNILSSFLKFCEKGSLKNKGESQLIGIILTWAEMNDVAVSAGQAIKEQATQVQSQSEGLTEMQKFLDAFHSYPGQLWLQVAEGKITEIPPVKFSLTAAQNITVDYTDGGDHYDMAVASLLHVVRLCRNKTQNAVEKFKDFFNWMCDNLLVSEYLLVYAAMLFTGQENIRAPKNSNSTDMDKVVAGCKNQAWDITYLTNWSTLYSYPDEYEQEFLFATNDILLKRIFINKHGVYGFNGLLHEIFTQKDYDNITDCIEGRMKNRVKPNFGDDTHAYFQTLIDEEIRQISLLSTSNEY